MAEKYLDVMELAKQRELAKRFAQLHRSGKLLVLPNAWDTGSAVMFEKAGFHALGTTSAGMAYSLGYPDGEHIEFKDILNCSSRILKRISLPLSVDVETGYSRTLEGAVDNVKKIIKRGAVGINIEDGVLGADPELTATGSQVKLIKALANLKAELEIPFFINARTDVYWLDIGEKSARLGLATERAHAYAEAGADGIFIPGRLDRESIRTLTRDLPLPLNLIATPDSLSFKELEALGVARLSLGSALVRASLGLIQAVASDLKGGSFKAMMDTSLSYQTANELFV